MSKEIIELVHELERDRGIEGDTLIEALEDALLAAYKKTPGATRHAVVELDRVEGDFRVFSIELPPDIEERLIEEARERVLTELEAAEVENGERSHVLVTDDDLDIDWSEIPDEKVKRADVTPDNFGRIAAQTAKQVITQRIREAERQIMYDEYVDRVTEVVTGIVQQAGDRNNVLVDLGKVEALLPRSEQVDGERYEQGSRIKAVITEVRSGTKGPQVILSRRDPELIRTLFELEVPEIADGLVEIRARRPRAWLPLEDRRRVARPGRRPGRCLRGAARLARAHGRLRAARREDRHHPVEPGAGPFRGQGAVARTRARGLPRRRRQGGDDRHPGRPARAGDRQGGHERPPGRAPDRLEDRHQVRHRVRDRGGRRGLRGRRRGGRRVHRPLLGGALDRQALPQRGAAGLSLLRRPRAPGAGAHGGRWRAAGEPEPVAASSRRPRGRRIARGGAAAEEPAVEAGAESRPAEEPVAEAAPEPEPEPPGRRGAGAEAQEDETAA